MSLTATTNLTGHFLIAMPSMDGDPTFTRALILLCEHNEHGALGIMVNRPLDLTLGGLFERIDLPLENQDIAAQPVYFGGPVQTDRGFVLHREPGGWHSTMTVNDHFCLTSSRDILLNVSQSDAPAEVLVSLGYAGWAAGQLEYELGRNSWLTVPASPAIVFELPPEERLAAAMHQLGIDFANLSDIAGHA